LRLSEIVRIAVLRICRYYTILCI